MGYFILRRLLHSILVVIGVSIIVFSLAYLTGEPTALVLPTDASAETIARYREIMGFDRPLHIQYIDFVSGALTGNFGDSFMQREDAMQSVIQRIPASMLLAMTAFTFSIIIAIPIGIISAVKRNTLIDYIARIFALLGQCTPTFYLGILLILFFSVILRWFPATGSITLRGLILPGITLGLFGAAEMMRLTRTNMLEILNLDYIRTARSKGLSEKVIIWKHAFRNALIPVVTIAALQFGALMGRSVITETVFSYPGMGLLAITAINNRDFLVVQAFVLVISVIVLILNIMADVLYGLIDPRIRYGKR